MFSAFAFGLVKVANKSTLLGAPDLNKLLTDALHIGLWNSIENDFVLMAAFLPSVRPLFRSRKQLSSTSKVSSSFGKDRSSHSTFDKNRLEK